MTARGRLLLLGWGTIGCTALPMLLDADGIGADRVQVLDGDDRSRDFQPWRSLGIDYDVARIDAGNVDAVLRHRLRRGDLLLNLTLGVDSVALADWCQSRGVAYVDTAIEPWEADAWNMDADAAERTEYAYHRRARAVAAGWPADGPTAVFTHGANPGLVSHFVKAALMDLAAALRVDVGEPADRAGWAALAERLGVRVIHVSERDTQRAAEPKRPDEFVNTWSIPGFVEEATMPAEVGWGTHERTLPPDAHTHAEGPANTIWLERPGGRVQLRSWVPHGGPIVGYALPHSECMTLSDYFTRWQDGRAVYRPTVAFAYLPCDLALASLHETMMRDWEMQSRERVLSEEITEGRDELGVLLMGHRLGAWWYGSELDIHEARRLVPGSNPTAVQVAAGAVAATRWALANPRAGFREPEMLPWREVLELARPWLGPMVSTASDWTPLANRKPLFDEPLLDEDDPWQFGNFLLP